jgi:hypothetical protein
MICVELFRPDEIAIYSNDKLNIDASNGNSRMMKRNKE